MFVTEKKNYKLSLAFKVSQEIEKYQCAAKPPKLKHLSIGSILRGTHNFIQKGGSTSIENLTSFCSVTYLKMFLWAIA